MKFFDARMSGWLLPSLLIAWTIYIPETWSKSPANSARPTSGSSAAQILTPAPVPVVTATSGHYGVQAIKFSPNGRFLATAGSPGEIKLWDIGSARLLRTMKQEETLIYGIAVSPDSRQVT